MSTNVLKNCGPANEVCGVPEMLTITDRLVSIVKTQDYDLDVLNTICSKLGIDYPVPPKEEPISFGITGMVESIQMRAAIFDSVLARILSEL
ncbi:MAG: hypothetical protein PHE79_08685 [Eubacteriales bacterium]|nr:hypothetical protein [Eubacteriales bacterium]